MEPYRLTVASLAAWLTASFLTTLPAGATNVEFTEHVISATADGAYSVFATDLDGDGDTDVLAPILYDNKIVWFESDGGSPPAFTERVISTNTLAPRAVFAVDLDGDNDVDVLSASSIDDKVAWYESDGGSPPSFTERVISTDADGAFSVFATDVDGDGHVDVLSGSLWDDKVAWYESDGGSPPSFEERVISTTPNEAWSVFATDVDGDGDTDVLSASERDGTITWYESDGGAPPAFTEHEISNSANGAHSVFAIDLDGDLDADVLSAASYVDRVVWYENDGGMPPRFTERYISVDADQVQTVFAIDIDGDLDVDVLSASRADHKVAWYESDGGSPPTFTERVISANADGARSVYATDLDRDGDIDVLCAATIGDKVLWYEQTQCGNGVVDGTEECDDGGAAGGDGCSSKCAVEFCGDGVVNNSGIEDCDDGGNANCDGCDDACVREVCGNDKVQCDEECDDGGTSDGDGCSSTCELEGDVPTASGWSMAILAALLLIGLALRFRQRTETSGPVE